MRRSSRIGIGWSRRLPFRSIAFEIGQGDGAYAVWIGRSADGEIACVVADGWVLSGATYLGPVQ